MSLHGQSLSFVTGIFSGIFLRFSILIEDVMILRYFSFCAAGLPLGGQQLDERTFLITILGLDLNKKASHACGTRVLRNRGWKVSRMTTYASGLVEQQKEKKDGSVTFPRIRENGAAFLIKAHLQRIPRWDSDSALVKPH